MARTLIAEDLRIEPRLIEQQLSHSVPEVHGRAYNRTMFLDERREMIAALCGPSGPSAGSTVMSIPPLWQAYEMPPRWYRDNWPDTVRIRTNDLIPEQGTGMWFRSPDAGERVHLIDLLPCADGWSPAALRDGRRVQGPLSDGDDVAAIAWRALTALSARTGQARSAAGQGRVSKWHICATGSRATQSRCGVATAHWLHPTAPGGDGALASLGR